MDIRKEIKSLGGDLEAVLSKRFPGERPAFAIAFTLPPEYDVCHWATNVSREDGVKLFADTAKKMIIEMN